MEARAVSVAEFSDFPEQAEVKFEPGAKFVVKALYALTSNNLNKGQASSQDEWDITFEESLAEEPLKLAEAKACRDLLIVVSQLPPPPKPKACYVAGRSIRPTQLRGIKLSTLEDIVDRNQTWLEEEIYCPFKDGMRMKNMHDVVAQIIKPSTMEAQTSYAELSPEPLPVEYFVSHCWNEEFVKFVAALRNFAVAIGNRDPVFWICSFANNQHRVDLGPSLAESPFNLALSADTCKGVVMVLDEALETLARIWCLFEVFRTFQLEHRFDLTTEAGCLTRASIEALQQGPSGAAQLRQLELLGTKLLSVNVEKAGSKFVEDKNRILAEVDRVVGREQMEVCIRSVLVRKLQEVMAHNMINVDSSLYVRLELMQAEAKQTAWLGRTELHNLAQRASEDKVQEAIRSYARADLLAGDDRGRHPLHYAVRYNRDAKAVSERLLAAGAILDAKDECLQTPLHLAVRDGREEVAQLLHERKASVLAVDSVGRNVLHCAAISGSISTLRLMLTSLAEERMTHVENLLEQRSSSGHTPFLYACCFGHKELAMEFHKNGACLDARARSGGGSALHEAGKHGLEELTPHLLAAGLPIDEQTNRGFTPLHWAAACNRAGVAKLLLHAKADPFIADKEQMMPLHRAVSCGSTDVVAVLLIEPGPLNASAPIHNGITLLHLAARRRTGSSMVEALLGRDADIAAVDGQGATPLHWACSHGCIETARVLLQRGADINACSVTGETPLALARLAGQEEAMKDLAKQASTASMPQMPGQPPGRVRPYLRGKKDDVRNGEANVEP